MERDNRKPQIVITLDKDISYKKYRKYMEIVDSFEGVESVQTPYSYLTWKNKDKELDEES